MEELKNKTFLIKVRSELFDYLKSENKHEKVGKMKIFLDKKRNRPEFIFHFNKEKGPKDYSLIYNEVKDFIYFENKELKDSKDEIKFNEIGNLGNLIVKEENEEDKLIKDIYNKEINKINSIQVQEVKDGDKRYIQHEPIHLSGKPTTDKDKKDKKLRIEDETLKLIVKKEVKNDEYITPAEISDKYSVPENQVKEILNKVCDKYSGQNRKYFYKIKDEFDQ